MALKSIKQCLNVVFECIEIRKKWDYGRGMSVCKYNSAYRRLARNVNYIAEHYPDRTDVLMDLLNHKDPYLVLHCAPLMLKFNNLSIEQKWKVLEIIKITLPLCEKTEISQYGFQLSIKGWEKDLLEEQKKQTD